MSADHRTAPDTVKTRRLPAIADAVEALESRVLMSVEMSAGQLIITGTNGDDVITISTTASDRNTILIEDNGVPTEIDLRNLAFDIRSIHVDGEEDDFGAGNDLIEFNGDFGKIHIAIEAFGGGGDDTLIGSQGNDYLSAGAGDDSLVGNAGNDYLFGADGDDIIEGVAGNDLADGADGFDTISGGAGGDSIRGGAGDDSINSGGGNDVIYGDDDNDDINAGSGNDLVRGGLDDDEIDGGTGNDRILGGDGDDVLNGSDGNDKIWGERGDDIIDAGDGADSIDGGLGSDQLTGGFGENTYYRSRGFNTSELLDFESGFDHLIKGTLQLPKSNASK
jgi:Ca2+-binding RTX toxin-like protein